MADDRPGTNHELKQRLARAGSDSERLAALAELRLEIAGLPRDEAEGYYREAIDLAHRTGDHENLARIAIVFSDSCLRTGDIARSLEYAGIVHREAASAGNARLEGSYFFLLGRGHEGHGDYGQARECYKRSLLVWRQVGHTGGVSAALNQLGSLAVLQGEAAEALEHFQECLRIDDELGDICNETLHQHNIGLVLQRLGRWENAFESYYRAIALAEQHEMPSLRATALNSLGELFLERDKATKAIGIFRMVMEAAERGEATPEALHDTMANLGLAHHRQGYLASAGQAYDQALAVAEKSGDRRVVAVVLFRMAELSLDQGQLDRCRELAERSIAVARDVGLRSEEAQALRVMALLLAACGEDAHARDFFEQAMSLLQDLEESVELARVRFHYGRYLLTQGERDAGAMHLQVASRAFRKLGIVAEGHEVNRLLFQQEMDVDSDAALLQGISGLTSLGVEPQVVLDRAVGLLIEGLRFESAVIFARGRPVLVFGNPDLVAAVALGASQELVATDLTLSWPVCYGGDLFGRIVLQRTAPAATEHSHLVLDTIANLLSVHIHRQSELAMRAVDKGPGLAGLRYRGVVSRNQMMADVLTTVCAVASGSMPVLIHGESGTGRELIARAIHDSGTRAGKSFVAAYCAGVPENSVESELFGVEEDAAAGVVVRKGKLETAAGGTLFLNEVCGMGPALQTKLLRVLQEKTFERVSGHVSINVDVRVVAATNLSFEELVAQHRFREDLYHELSAVELLLPSLGERREDIPDLVHHFVRRSNQEFRRNVVDVSPEVMSRLATHSWPGNIRELEQVIERAVLLAREDTIQLQDLPPSLQSPPPKGS